MSDKKILSKKQIVSFLSKQEDPVSVVQILDHFYDVKEKKERARLYGSLSRILKKMCSDQTISQLVFGRGRGDLYYLRKSSKGFQRTTMVKTGKSPGIISVALIDSNILFRKSLEQLLSSWKNIKVSIDVNNGKLLIEKLNRSAAVPDICIISTSAILSDNSQTIMRLKNDFPLMSVLILADHYHEFTIRKVMYDGANGYLTKQCSPEELKRAIQSLYKIKNYWTKIPNDNQTSFLTIWHSDHLVFGKPCSRIFFVAI